MIVTSQTQQILIEHDTYSKNVFLRKIKANAAYCFKILHVNSLLAQMLMTLEEKNMNV